MCYQNVWHFPPTPTLYLLCALRGGCLQARDCAWRIPGRETAEQFCQLRAVSSIVAVIWGKKIGYLGASHSSKHLLYGVTL